MININFKLLHNQLNVLKNANIIGFIMNKYKLVQMIIIVIFKISSIYIQMKINVFNNVNIDIMNIRNH